MEQKVRSEGEKVSKKDVLEMKDDRTVEETLRSLQEQIYYLHGQVNRAKEGIRHLGDMLYDMSSKYSLSEADSKALTDGLNRVLGLKEKK